MHPLYPKIGEKKLPKPNNLTYSDSSQLIQFQKEATTRNHTVSDATEEARTTQPIKKRANCKEISFIPLPLFIKPKK